MKKSCIKSFYKLKVINDGASFYRWVHPWKGWVPLTNKDISSYHMWKGNLSSTLITPNKTSYIKEYAKKFNKK